MEGSSDHSGQYGRAPEQWNHTLQQALERHDHEGLVKLLRELRSELGGQVEALEGLHLGPGLTRMVEQARRILRSTPTAMEALEQELDHERRVWAEYRRRYTEAFVPAALHPFLDSCGVFLQPTDEGLQFDGFDKIAGRSSSGHPQAVTFYVRTDDPADAEETPANFFGSFDPRRGRFVIERAYRTFLPPGAGTPVIAEQIRWLVPDIADLRVLEFDNVQNRRTYEVFVQHVGGDERLVPDADPQDAPLTRVGQRVLEQLGLTATAVRPIIDGFGFLDLCLEVD